MVGYKFKPAQPEAASLTAVTTGTGRAIPMQDCRYTVWTVEGSGTITGGTVLIETADTMDYAGTWHALDTVSAAAGAYNKGIDAAGAGFIRARVSSNVTGGGNITVRINGLLA